MGKEISSLATQPLTCDYSNISTTGPIDNQLARTMRKHGKHKRFVGITFCTIRISVQFRAIFKGKGYINSVEEHISVSIMTYMDSADCLAFIAGHKVCMNC